MRSVSYGSNSIFSPVGWHFKLRSDLVKMGVSSWGECEGQLEEPGCGG